MFTEDEFIHIGALQHYVYCPRQCALIHVEGVWEDNVFTVRGEILHEKVHTDSYESRGALRTVRGLKIHSWRLGIVGRADVVEFRPPPTPNAPEEVLPVEFKSGRPKENLSDKAQLCAQVMCLEEMLGTRIARGAFYYDRIRRRHVVDITHELRRQTEEIISAVHDIVRKQLVPTAKFGARCRHCSLENICAPKSMNERKLRQYMEALYKP
ncbi:MAG: PD-(D/E)XK nuclease superfamily protein [Syntrophorhabdus sp. PtaU1.Bin153]|nr:MAG: PD-(D/E)XK nuclease superfamily protein [Syntrophorhabdus sp. PtaU1.Bin153]